MKIFAISDPHLSFSTNKPMDIFGEEWTDHGNKIKNAWHELVSQDDIVIIPGDISWALKFDDAIIDLEWIKNLPGTKVLLRGNHDLWWSSISKLNNLFPGNMIFLQNNSLCFDNIGICGSRGWDLPFSSENWDEHNEKIYKRELIRLEMSLKSLTENAKYIIAAMHYPPTDSRGRVTEFTKLFEKFNVSQVIYGHIHGSDKKKYAFNGSLNGIKYNLVSCDILDFKPILLKEV